MLEKEIKILEIDVAFVTDKLLKLWAKKTFEWHISDTYFDFHDKAKYKHQEAARIFRLREKWNKSIYTVKETKELLSKKEKVVVKEEHEVEVSDPWTFSKTLKMQGMIPIRKKQKHRVSFKLDAIAFDIDTYEGIPTFIEIEWPSWKVIFEWIKHLFLEEKERLVGGSRMIFDRYNVPYTYCD